MDVTLAAILAFACGEPVPIGITVGEQLARRDLPATGQHILAMIVGTGTSWNATL